MRNPFFKNQILTYIGNKRRLLDFIEENIIQVKRILNLKKLKLADLFSGSGVVAGLLKEHSSFLLVNDIENYAYSLNQCYLANRREVDRRELDQYIDFINKNILRDEFSKKGIISYYYSPKFMNSISSNDRVYYTPRNALFIDSVRTHIEQKVYEKQYHFILAPLLVKASIHVNTGGVFKSFYRKNGIGHFGGKNEDALKRILHPIYLDSPIFSKNEAEVEIHSEDILQLLSKLKDKEFDLIYLDPPYNQHPYGSNYFMLNLIYANKIDENIISKKSGIPKNWKRSSFYKKDQYMSSLGKVIDFLPTKYILLSYSSSGGFIKYQDILGLLEKYGKVDVLEIPYTIFRACRNISKRKDSSVKEYMFLIKKK